MPPIEITTKRLQLKPHGTKYLSTTTEYALDAENTRFMCHLPNDTAEETANFLRNVDAEWQKLNPTFFEFAILFKNKHIGAVSLYSENGSGELGWIINKNFWHNGFAFEAASALVHYFSKNMNVKHFIARCDTQNIASYKTMEKLGMKRIGEWGGRKNRSSQKESFEFQYELWAE